MQKCLRTPRHAGLLAAHLLRRAFVCLYVSQAPQAPQAQLKAMKDPCRSRKNSKHVAGKQLCRLFTHFPCDLELCTVSLFDFPLAVFSYCYRLFSSFSQVRISHAVTMNDEEDFLSPAGQRRKTLRSMTTSNLSLSPTRSFAPTTSPERGKLNRRSDPTLLSSRQSPRKSSKTIMEKVQKFLGLQLANCLRLFKS